MARRTIKRGAGNWNDPNCWEEGELPTIDDDVIAIRGSGPITIDVDDAVCSTLDLGNYIGNFIFAEESKLTASVIRLTAGSGLIFVNPIDTLVLDYLINVVVDMTAQTMTFDGVIIVPYV